MKHLLRSHHSFNKRHLILSDSISAVCALDRGRGRSFKMRRVTQQIGALILASNTSFSYRWIPSEWNPADGPSRGSRFPSVPSRFPDKHDSQVSADRIGTFSSQGIMEQDQEEGIKSAFKEDTWFGVNPCGVNPCGVNPCGVIHGLKDRQEEGEGRNPAGGGESSRCIGGAELQEKVRRVLGEVPKAFPHEVHWQLSAGVGRSEAGSSSGWDVCGGRGLGTGSIHGGCSSIQAAPCKIPSADEDANDSSGHARLAQARSSEVEASFAMGGGLPYDEVLHGKSDDSRGAHDGSLLCVLSPSGGGDKASVMDLVAPVGKRKSSTVWSIVLHPQEELESSKTSEFDESIMFDLEEMMHIPVAVAKWRRIDRKHARDPLFTVTAAQFNKAMEIAGQATGVANIGPPHPYRLSTVEPHTTLPTKRESSRRYNEEVGGKPSPV